jgi:hypothetical protein
MCNGNCQQGRECNCSLKDAVITASASAPLTAKIKPDYYISFYNESGTIGTLDFNGPAMKFEGDAEESATIFFRWIAEKFHGRLLEERQKGREEK